MASTTSGKPIRSRRGAPNAGSASRTDAVIPTPIPSVHIATITAIRADGMPMLSMNKSASVPAAVLAHLTADQMSAAFAAGTQVLVNVIDGDAARPIIVGFLGKVTASPRHAIVAKVDGRRVELTGQDEVVLTCGKASITLTKEGRIILRGSYIASSSAGVNRITGGSVQIN